MLSASRKASRVPCLPRRDPTDDLPPLESRHASPRRPISPDGPPFYSCRVDGVGADPPERTGGLRVRGSLRSARHRRRVADRVRYRLPERVCRRERHRLARRPFRAAATAGAAAMPMPRRDCRGIEGPARTRRPGGAYLRLVASTFSCAICCALVAASASDLISASEVFFSLTSTLPSASQPTIAPPFCCTIISLPSFVKP